MTTQRIITGDCIEGLRTIPDASVHCCVTSPPYLGLRDYGHDGQIGLESTPEEYVARMVAVFREVRRVLRDDGTAWVNLGDSYHNLRTHNNGGVPTNTVHVGGSRDGTEGFGRSNRNHRQHGLKEKDLVGIPWRVAFALQADGWYLRQDIIWHKPNPMPESVRDRCTKAHEYVFLLAKSQRYYYDAEAVREPDSGQDHPRAVLDGQPSLEPSGGIAGAHRGIRTVDGRNGQGRNRRSVWTITTKPYSGAHFAVMPPDLVEPCIKAGCPDGGTVLDPFAGSGTTLAVAAELGRNAIGCELNPDYVVLAEQRIKVARESVALFEGMGAA
jgi:site-specific DNA-methyltransferase (adenine-specific)